MSLTIAQTILRQLGGGRFLAMVGGKDLIDTGDGLRMTIARCRGGCNRLEIRLTPDDLYTIVAAKLVRLDYIEIERSEGCYVDMLHSEIERLTGLRTSL